MNSSGGHVRLDLTVVLLQTEDLTSQRQFVDYGPWDLWKAVRILTGAT